MAKGTPLVLILEQDTAIQKLQNLWTLIATHIHFFVNFQVFEWLNHVSLVKSDVLLLIMPNHAGVDDLIIQRLVAACNKGNRRRLHSGKTTSGSQHQGLVVCVLVYCKKKQ